LEGPYSYQENYYITYANVAILWYKYLKLNGWRVKPNGN
jgi:hypothetical protein